MRYSRALMVLALIGVVALTATLVTHGGRAAAKPERTAATKPTLRSALIQQLQQLQPLLTTQPPARPFAPSVTVPPSARPCPVASGSCSGNPCVVFVQAGNEAVTGQSVQNVIAPTQPGALTPTLPGGPRAQGCSRHALPRTLRVSSSLAPVAPAPQGFPVSAPVLTASPHR